LTIEASRKETSYKKGYVIKKIKRGEFFSNLICLFIAILDIL